MTTFVAAGDQTIADYDGAGTLLRRYVYGAGLDEPIVTITVNGATSTKAYNHQDGLGSVVALSDGATGALTDSYAYGPYGQSATLAGNAFRFTGRRLDAESGLYYYRARYYSPSLGRFLQTDPIGTQGGINLYAYVGNDPLNLTDPSGLFARQMGSGAWGLPKSGARWAFKHFRLILKILGIEAAGDGPEDPVADAAAVAKIIASIFLGKHLEASSLVRSRKAAFDP